MRDIEGEFLNFDDMPEPGPAAPDPARVFERDEIAGGRGDIDALPPLENNEELSVIQQRLQAILDADIRKLYKLDGSIKPIHEWPAVEALAVAHYSINKKTGYTVVKMCDKVRAAEHLAKIEGLFAKDNAQKHPLLEILADVPRSELKNVVALLKDMSSRD